MRPNSVYSVEPTVWTSHRRKRAAGLGASGKQSTYLQARAFIYLAGGREERGDRRGGRHPAPTKKPALMGLPVECLQLWRVVRGKTSPGQGCRHIREALSSAGKGLWGAEAQAS